MKTSIIILLLSLFSVCVFSQDYSDPQNMDVDYTQDASYPGGMNKLAKDLHLQMNFSHQAVENRVRGTMSIGFDVNTDGTISDLRIFEGINEEIDKEFRRVFLSLKFQNAVLEGNPVKMNTMLDIPIMAVSEQEKEKM